MGLSLPIEVGAQEEPSAVESPDQQEEAQEEDEEAEASDSDSEAPEVEARATGVDALGGRVRIPRPTGWRIARINDEGVVVTFRSASDRDAQIEVRMSDGVSAARWDRYVRTFDNEVQQSGFQVHQAGIQRNYGGRRGRFVEYELDLDEDVYRLVIWHTHEGDRAWVFSGFFREGRRDAHFRTFEEIVGQVEWSL